MLLERSSYLPNLFCNLEMRRATSGSDIADMSPGRYKKPMSIVAPKEEKKHLPFMAFMSLAVSCGLLAAAMISGSENSPLALRGEL